MDIILNSETSIGATLAQLKKALTHYEKQKMDLYTKRQKYRIAVANYKGPANDEKLEMIKQILHNDLPKLIDEMDDRIINGHAQLASLTKQLENLRAARLKAERSYKKMFEPMPEGDLEAGMEDDSEDSEEVGKNVSIEYILSKYDPINFPPAVPAAVPSEAYDTSSDDEQHDGQVVKRPADLSIHPEPHNALSSDLPSSKPTAASSSMDSESHLESVPLD